MLSGQTFFAGIINNRWKLCWDNFFSLESVWLGILIVKNTIHVLFQNDISAWFQNPIGIERTSVQFIFDIWFNHIWIDSNRLWYACIWFITKKLYSNSRVCYCQLTKNYQVFFSCYNSIHARGLIRLLERLCLWLLRSIKWLRCLSWKR